MKEKREPGDRRANPRVIVIGGGPAGLLAAGYAARQGAEVVLLEKMHKPGLKLGITGKGRCNVTNAAPLREFLAHFGTQGRFLRQALNRFSPQDLQELFASIGIATVVERGGRVFPEHLRAPAVASRLTEWVKKGGVRVQTHTEVLGVTATRDRVTGVRIRGEQGESVWPCHALIVATGGASYPQTGSTGEGASWMTALGHTVVPCRPALVPLETAGDTAARLQGLSLRNVEVSLWLRGKKTAQAFGEMVFTHFGVSGPVVLELSQQAVDLLRNGECPELCIDLKPALDETKLDARLLRDIQHKGKKQIANWLRDLLPTSLIPICLEATGLDGSLQAGQMTARQRRNLKMWLKYFPLPLTGYRGFEEAIVTAGGVALQEVDPRTMQSKLVPGLYLAGEILDLAADTGGYNLQAAFSTGVVAGEAAGIAVSRSTG